MEQARDIGQRVIANIEKVIIGKSKETQLAVIALLAQGHALIEDVPGVGKTMLAKSLARSTSCTFKRIQFTPDLLPGDITGVAVYNQKLGDFEFRPGPIMAQIVLADEINRAAPKTQSALLECMEERQVTVDGITHRVGHPFMVLATQNPIEYEGTFPLPEAQLDRFLLKITLGYPSATDEVAIIERQQFVHPVEELEPVVGPGELTTLQETIKRIYVDTTIKAYIVSLVEATRHHPSVYLGASPRGSLGLFRTSQTMALLQGRDYVLPDDVKAVAEPVLAHRLIINSSARMREVSGETVVREILQAIPVSGARAQRPSMNSGQRPAQ